MQTKCLTILPILAALAWPSLIPAQEPAPPATTGWKTKWDNYWHEIHVHRRRVAYWPDPFVLPDRELVRAPFRCMVDNGWVHETTLVDALFDPESNELTYGGRMRVRGIMTEAPPHRRHVFVLEGATPEDTAARVASVQQWLAHIAPEVGPGSVSTTSIAPRGGSGYYLDEIQDAYRQSVPAPRLPANTTPGFNPAQLFGGGGGGNSSSQ